jgi:hypothetical protein
MKGQVFIILAAFLILGLIMLRVSTKTILEKSQNLLPENFLNLKSELTQTVDISLLKNEDLQSNINEFVTFSSKVLKERGYLETVKYSINKVDKTTTVDFELNLSFQNDYLDEKFRVERKVYG